MSQKIRVKNDGGNHFVVVLEVVNGRLIAHLQNGKPLEVVNDTVFIMPGTGSLLRRVEEGERPEPLR